MATDQGGTLVPLIASLARTRYFEKMAAENARAIQSYFDFTETIRATTPNVAGYLTQLQEIGQSNARLLESTYAAWAEQASAATRQAIEAAQWVTVPSNLLGETLRNALVIAPAGSDYGAAFGRLAETLRTAQEEDLDAEGTARAIEERAPEFSGLAQPLRQVKQWDLRTWLMILLGVINLLVSSTSRVGTPDGPNAQQVEQFWEQTLNTLREFAPSPLPVTPPTDPPIDPPHLR